MVTSSGVLGIIKRNRKDKRKKVSNNSQAIRKLYRELTLMRIGGLKTHFVMIQVKLVPYLLGGTQSWLGVTKGEIDNITLINNIIVYNFTVK